MELTFQTVANNVVCSDILIMGLS